MKNEYIAENTVLMRIKEAGFSQQELAEALGVEIVELFNMSKNNEFHCPNCGVTLELKVKEA